MELIEDYKSKVRSARDIYRPQRSCGQGYVFTRVCDSVKRGGLPQCMLGYPPGSRHPPPGADSGIRSMSGRYASYWKAFLFRIFHVVLRSVSKRKLNCKGLFTLDESESEIASRRVHRESNLMFTSNSDKDQTKKFAFPNCE